MFVEDDEVKKRCEDCKFRKHVHANSGYSFYGCYHIPHAGTRLSEIKYCPIETER